MLYYKTEWSTASLFIPWLRHNPCWKGVCGNVWFPNGCLDVSYRSQDKSKNPCQCGNCTFSNLVHHQNLESTCPAASCFPGTDYVPCCEMCNLCTCMCSCYTNNYTLCLAQHCYASSVYCVRTNAGTMSQPHLVLSPVLGQCQAQHHDNLLSTHWC